MDAIRMNHDYLSEGSHVDEELNIDASVFLNFWKISINHYRMDAQIIVNYRTFHDSLPSS